MNPSSLRTVASGTAPRAAQAPDLARVYAFFGAGAVERPRDVEQVLAGETIRVDPQDVTVFHPTNAARRRLVWLGPREVRGE
jgi:hypothetical protein